MIERTLEVRFLSPAFLGNAKQQGEWRVPPFKALLRQWWRMAVARDVGFNPDALRAREGQLFGTVNGAGGKARKSRLKLRLGHWKSGTLDEWNGKAGGGVGAGRFNIPATVYLGYGPVLPESRREAKPVRLKAAPAIKPLRESTQLRLWLADGCGASPEEQAAIERTLDLIEAYGTLGGRSRNGWGSLTLGRSLEGFVPPLVPWQEAIERDWAHGIGKDGRGALVWRTGECSTWENAIGELARLRFGLRKAVGEPLLLSYPCTGKTMPGWGREARLPATFRFKVRPAGKGVVGIVFHVPCRPPDRMWAALDEDQRRRYPDVCEQAHRFLDGKLARIAA